VLAAQTELLCQIAQGQQWASYQDFLSTQPPLFNKAEEPLDADAWIRTIESKVSLLTIPCSKASKAYFAAQQLRGVARMWWDNYHGMLPADHVVTWDEIKMAFRRHHILASIFERKLNEFLALTQGSRAILQYAQNFNHLCQYAGYHVDTNAKKRDHFRRGLNIKLQEGLNLVWVDTYNELVNMAITQEDFINAIHAEKKRKESVGSSGAQPPRYRIVQNAPAASSQKAP